MDAEPSLALIGFMATGKSTIGRRCARILGYRFRDSDALIESRAGKPVARIFEEDGEPAFRALEVDAIRDLCRERRVVLATGGGAPLDPLNAARLRRRAIVVLLCVDAVEIVRRASRRRTRPLLDGAPDPLARVEEMLRSREAAYRAAAHAAVETTGLSPEEAVELVLAAYRRILEQRLAGRRRGNALAGAQAAEGEWRNGRCP